MNPEQQEHDDDPSSTVFTLVPLKQQLPLAAKDGITSAGAADGVLWIGTEAGRVFRWKTDAGELEEARGRIGSMRLGSALRRVFVERYGRGALLVTRDGQLFYGGGRASVVRLREVKSARSLGIRVLSWIIIGAKEYDGTEARGRTELVAVIGGRKGEVWALRLDQAQKSDTVAKLWTAPDGERLDGINVEKVAGRFVGAVATVSRLYLFDGADTLVSLFRSRAKLCDCVTDLEIKKGGKELEPERASSFPLPSELQFMSATKNNSVGRKFVWAHSSGILYAQLAVRRSQHEGERNLVVSVSNKGIIRWSTLKEDSGSSAPMACNLSSFHVLILYPSLLLAYSSISGVLIHKISLWRPVEATVLSRDSPLLHSPAAGFARDAVADVLWIFTSDNQMARLKICEQAEQVSAWKAAKQCGRFDLALALAPVWGESASQRARLKSKEQVLISQAEKFAADDDYQSAVKLYAKTHLPLERVCLSIVSECQGKNEHKMRSLLIDYLVRKLDYFTYDQFSQKTAIAMMLLELYGSSLSSFSRDGPQESHDRLRNDFRRFLNDHHKEIHLRSAIQVLSSHDCLDAALHLSMLQENAISAIDVCLLKKDYKRAINVARASFLQGKDMETEKADALAYMTSLVALFEPKKLAEVWMEASAAGNRKLDDLMLVTTLLSIVKGADWGTPPISVAANLAYDAGVSYIEYVLPQLSHQAKLQQSVHPNEKNAGNTTDSTHNAANVTLRRNLVLSLFELHTHVGDEAAALRSYDRLEICDRETLILVLRCSHRANFLKLRVRVYLSLEMYEQAVGLALEFDCSLAESVISSIPPGRIGKSRHRKLWCDIAKGSDDPVELSSRSNGILRIEDILQVMPDFTRVPLEVQAKVITSIENNKSAAQSAKLASQMTVKSIETLRAKVQELKKWRETVKRSKVDGTTMFPCGHSVRGNVTGSCTVCGPAPIDSIDIPIDMGITPDAES